MSKFEQMIRHHWQTYLPHAWSQLRDPEQMVKESAVDLESEIQTLAASIAGLDVAGETSMQKIARLMSARRDAESDLIREFLPSPEEHLEAQDAEDLEREMTWLQDSAQWRLDLIRGQAESEVLGREDLTQAQQQEEIERIFQSLVEQDTLRAAHEETLARSR